ncbi:MAG: hypothetical protein LBU47_01730, partial [Christensenellaceae bacterium]|nr:hypothetical protein [Christensenellaceae bacterium]
MRCLRSLLRLLCFIVVALLSSLRFPRRSAALVIAVALLHSFRHCDCRAACTPRKDEEATLHRRDR